jgi:ParB-like chromosome segregation protein Spo0J
MAHDIAPELVPFAVPIGKVRTHPKNPRLGQVDVIVESLKAHGQYRPIVVQESTGYVLAGNHTWQAAKKLGWSSIAAVYVDVDDNDAIGILLVDNRAADLGTYDTAELLALIEELPGLDGTGWDEHDVDRLQAALEAALALSNPGGERKGKISGRDVTRVVVGRIGLTVPNEHWEPWHDSLLERFPDNKAAIVAWARFQLDLPVAAERKIATRKKKKIAKAKASVEHASLNDCLARVDVLKHPDYNPRQGDVGVIAESLRVHGQYRPVVVNRPTMEVLAGNHTLMAAKALGWKEIAVSFVDVDEEEARRIILVDNRSADLAGYDESVLAGLLQEVNSWEGTGFDADDVEALLAGYGLMRDDLHTPIEDRGADEKMNASILIGPHQFVTPSEDYERWEYQRRTEVGHEPEALCRWVVDALGLPPHWSPWRMLNSKRTKNRED